MCSVETTQVEPLNQWYTSCSIYSTPARASDLELYLGCKLTNIDLNNKKYTYLFVHSYKNVDLTYSNWCLSTDNCIPPQTVFWYGKLEVTGEAKENVIYIFRFPRKTIVPHEAQWLKNRGGRLDWQGKISVGTKM